MTDLVCPTCGGADIARAGSIVAPRGRVQRYRCVPCGKKFHLSLRTPQPLWREGYFDIETSQAGRGAGNFGIIYSWAIKAKDRPGAAGTVYSDIMRRRTQADEKRVVRSLLRTMRQFDVLYTWYGTGHDFPIARTRAVYHGLEFPSHMALYHRDLLFAFRGRFKLHSNRLESAAGFLGVNSKTPLTPEVWVAASFGDRKALSYILEHNIEDVITLERVHEKIEAYIDPAFRRSI